MKFQTISVTVGLTVPHPHMGYSSIRSEMTATATLDPDESASNGLVKLHSFLAEHLKRRVESWVDAELEQPTGHRGR